MWHYVTDKYFEKTHNCVADLDTVVTYGVFLRYASIAAVDPAIDFIKHFAPRAKIWRHYPEGALVPAETPVFSYQDEMRNLVKLETQMLQRVGFSSISAFNAYQMCSALPGVPFLDMAARHCAPDEGGTGMMDACAYGASVGSNTAKLVNQAKGFIGSSLDMTAHYYGAEAGMGTMPHALIGLAGSTVNAVRMFVEHNPNDKFIVALVDYFGKEYSDALECARWFRETEQAVQGKTLGVRLDTHGGRFAEGLDYESSIEIVSDWLHVKGKWPIVEYVMGEEAFDVADDAAKDRVAKTLFGTGVSAANIMQMRRTLNVHGGDVRGGGDTVKIVASSGFNLRKCRIMAKSHAPIDLVGTGSFLPETMTETYATADVFGYNGEFRVKVGREYVFREAAKQTLGVEAGLTD